MRAHVEVLGAGNADAAAGLLLFFDDARYIFECGDGTQRYCTERTVRLGRLRGIYLTSLTAPSVGGLLGMVLTIADAGKDKVTIAGPKGLSKLFSSAQRSGFCYRPAMQTEILEIAAPSLMMEPTLLPGSKNSESLPLSVVICQDDNVVIRAVPVLADLRLTDGLLNRECAGIPVHCVLSYVCRMRDIKGRFNPRRAVELGVPKGPDFGRLTRGEEIILTDGSIVRPEDVMSPSTQGPVVLIIACPSVWHVGTIISSPDLCPVALGLCDADDSGRTPPVCVVYHRTPRDVLADPRYQEWCCKFAGQTTHIALHSSIAPERIVFASQCEDLEHLKSYENGLVTSPLQFLSENDSNQHKLSDILKDPDGLLHGSGVPPNGSSQNWHVGDCGMQFVLAPVNSSGICMDEVPPRFGNDRSESGKNYADNGIAKTGSTDFSPESDMANPTCVSHFSTTTAEVCFLGTAAAIPGKHRNVSGILLDLFVRGAVILDCGEGTWGQLNRGRGMHAARDILRNLKIIFISHIHADHHLGLLTILYERRYLLSNLDPNDRWPELVIIGPTQLKEWLTQYENTVYGPDVKLPYKFCDADELTDPQRHEAKFFVDSYGLEIACVRVIHCPNSYGIVILDKLTGWKVVYSGDTRPCQALAEAGSGATLAIHEATLDDTMAAEAALKNHSTTSDALRVCADWMGAWRTILTHFSQRYPRVPVLDEATMRKLSVGRAAVAFDLMRINFADLATLPHVMAAIRAAFPDEVVEPEGDLQAHASS